MLSDAEGGLDFALAVADLDQLAASVPVSGAPEVLSTIARSFNCGSGARNRHSCQRDG